MRSLQRSRIGKRLDLSTYQKIIIAICLFEFITSGSSGNIIFLKSSQISDFNTTRTFFKNSFTPYSGNIETFYIENQFHDSDCLYKVHCSGWGHTHRLEETKEKAFITRHSIIQCTEINGNDVIDIPTANDFEVTQSNISDHPTGKSVAIGVSNNKKNKVSFTTFQGVNMSGIYSQTGVGNTTMEKVNFVMDTGTQMFYGTMTSPSKVIESVFIENSYESLSNGYAQIEGSVSFKDSFSSGSIEGEVEDRPTMIGTVVRLDYECNEVFTQLFSEIGVRKGILVEVILFAMCA